MAAIETPEDKLAALRTRLIGDEGTNPQAGRSHILGTGEAEEFAAILEEAGQQTLFFGRPLVEALKEGFQVTRRGVFEMTDWRAATDTTVRLAEIFDQIGTSSRKRLVFDAFAGSGQVTFALANKFPIVYALEQDPITYECLANNLSRGGVSHMTRTMRRNSESFLIDVKDNTFGGIYIDPPWNGNFKYSPEQPFSLGHTAPPADRLTLLALSKASVAALKLPINAGLEEIGAFAQTNGIFGLVDEQIVNPNHPSFNQLTVYFTRTMVGEPNRGTNLTYSRRVLTGS